MIVLEHLFKINTVVTINISRNIITKSFNLCFRKS